LPEMVEIENIESKNVFNLKGYQDNNLEHNTALLSEYNPDISKQENMSAKEYEQYHNKN